MTISKIVAGAGVVLSLTMFTPALFAQTPGSTDPSAPAASGSMNNPANAGTGTSAMPSTSGSSAAMPSTSGSSASGSAAMNATGTESGGDVYSMETQLQKQINQLRSEGKSVSRAERHLREGEMSLNKGRESTASKHFEMAQRELSRAEGGSASMSGSSASEGSASENSGTTSATGSSEGAGASSESGSTGTSR